MKYLGYSFEAKVKTITEFVNENLTELQPTWDTIKMKIRMVNRERRFLAHGFHNYFLPNDHISTRIKENGKIVEKKQTLSDIKKLVDQVQHLNTGENGVNGEFYISFTTMRIDKWNLLVNDDHKIVYTVNSQIVSEWKGK